MAFRIFFVASLVLFISNLSWAEEGSTATGSTESTASADTMATEAPQMEEYGFAGNDVNCKLGSMERAIKVAYKEEGKKIPCQVNYKDRIGLYSASFQEGYCEEKQAELRGRLESGGWTCTGGDDAASSGTEASTESTATNTGSGN